MTSELEANIVAVERTKEYAEAANEVCLLLVLACWSHNLKANEFMRQSMLNI